LPTDEELKRLLAKHPKDESSYLLGEEFVFLPISLNTYFDNFLSDAAKMNMRMYNEQIAKHKDFTFTKLEQQASGDLSRKYECICPVTGVPWCFSTRFFKTEKITRKK